MNTLRSESSCEIEMFHVRDLKESQEENVIKLFVKIEMLLEFVNFELL